MIRRHRMPFGAEIGDDGRVRFRLWAPTAKTVDLCLEADGRDVALPMTAGDKGWFDLTTEQATVGSRYRFRIDGDSRVPDPASRFQPDDVHGASEVIDPGTYRWNDVTWHGRSWEETVLYELHVGSFTPEGNFTGVMNRLDDLSALGVTAVELMPVADFPGRRNWGYDGVYTFAPESRYGRPEDLKRLVDAAHERGLMMFLDVVYNHFGPEGNYLHRYAEQFFTERHHTPWGAAINFDGEGSRAVRDFFIHNALYWLGEYHFDGLRFDAVHAIRDDSEPDILVELAQTVHRQLDPARKIHLVLENDDNKARYLKRTEGGRVSGYVAQWNDDIHHAMHVCATGECAGYYLDYADAPLKHLGRCLTEGFAYQGDPSPFRQGQRRGEPSRELPYVAFVSFLQNHDQVGNRAFGERIDVLAKPEAVRALTAIFLLAPAPPMLFMGEEWGAHEPFPFFCDFEGELAQAVTAGRRREFERFPEFTDAKARERIPDPNAPATFASAILDWQARERADGADWLALHGQLLELRAREIVPHLTGTIAPEASYTVENNSVLRATWRLPDGSMLYLLANLGSTPQPAGGGPSARCIYPAGVPTPAAGRNAELEPWSTFWFVGGNGIAP